MNDKLHVGQTLYYKSTPRMGHAEVREATIVSIGKKYFYIDERKRDKIEISSMQMITYNGMGVKLYTSKQDILDGIERTKLFDAISKQFQWVNSNKFTLEQLRQIDQILTP